MAINELRKSQQTARGGGYGFTLVEVLITLSVAALVAVGVFLGSQRALDRANSYETLRHIQHMAIPIADINVSGTKKADEANLRAAMKTALGCGTDTCKSPFGTPYTPRAGGASLQIQFDARSATAASGLVRILEQAKRCEQRNRRSRRRK